MFHAVFPQFRRYPEEHEESSRLCFQVALQAAQVAGGSYCLISVLLPWLLSNATDFEETLCCYFYQFESFLSRFPRPTIFH